MTLVLLTWCPDPTKAAPCANMPCQPSQPPEPSSGYPPWHSLAYDGVVSMRFLYQLQTPFVGIPILWGGHDITFGPHALPDPGMWFQQVNSGPGVKFFIATEVSISDMPTVSLPNTPISGTDGVAVRTADLTAQWQAYDYAVANPP